VVTVFVPATLRALTDGERRVAVVAATLGEAVDRLEERYPGFRDAVVEDGRLRPGLAAAIGSEIATLGLLEPLPEGAEVHFLPATGGG